MSISVYGIPGALGKLGGESQRPPVRERWEDITQNRGMGRKQPSVVKDG